MSRQEAPQECGLREALSAKPPSLRNPFRPQNQRGFQHRLPASTECNTAWFTMKFRIYPECFDKTSPKHCFSNVNACREGFSREGGASRSESNESIASGNRTTNTSALRREQAAVSASLEPHSFPLSWRDKKEAPGGTQPTGEQSFCLRHKTKSFNYGCRIL